MDCRAGCCALMPRSLSSADLEHRGRGHCHFLLGNAARVAAVRVALVRIREGRYAGVGKP
eukprot:12615300-Heterocapsa_arctica.AAC.1